jgi:hypothetical protein
MCSGLIGMVGLSVAACGSVKVLGLFRGAVVLMMATCAGRGQG